MSGRRVVDRGRAHLVFERWGLTKGYTVARVEGTGRTRLGFVVMNEDQTWRAETKTQRDPGRYRTRAEAVQALEAMVRLRGNP